MTNLKDEFGKAKTYATGHVAAAIAIALVVGAVIGHIF